MPKTLKRWRPSTQIQVMAERIAKLMRLLHHFFQGSLNIEENIITTPLVPVEVRL